ncbi:hypothetical protein HDU86_001102 [Geranomyces michiganensis]|nr:hypothetical protein HDU86_001102 [Geranomyces michiganensis]
MGLTAVVGGRRTATRRLFQLLALVFLLVLAAASSLLHSAGSFPREATWRLWRQNHKANDKVAAGRLPPLPGVSGRQSTANTLEHFPAQPAPLCLVVAWQQGDRLPAYVRTSLDTFGGATAASAAKGSASFAELYLFLPPSMSVKTLEDLYGGRRDWPSNVYAVDIGDVDPAWRRYGWLGFITDNLYRLYAQSGHLRSETRSRTLSSWLFPWRVRNELRTAVDKSLRNNGNPLVQLRPVYGDLFAPWINSRRCSTWAWADLDTLWGDLPGLVNAPLLLSDSDVFTISFGDENRVYTRGQFTAFNHAQTPAVDAAWRRCSDLANMERAIAFFEREGWAALDEGCSANAVISSGLRFTVVPIQEPDGAALMRFDRGVLLACRIADRARLGAASRAACRDAMRARTDALVGETREPRVSPFAGKASETQALELTQPPDWESSCAGWLPASETWCVADGRLWDRSAWWVQRVNSAPSPVSAAAGAKGTLSTSKSISQRHAYPPPLDPRKFMVVPPGQAKLELEVYEVAVMHMQGWKRRLLPTQFTNLDALDLAAGRAVVEVYEDGEGSGEGEEESRGVVLRVVRV